MANLSALAANAQDIIYLSASGTGAIDDPFVSHFTVEGIDLVATEDTLQAVKIKLDTLPVVANRISVTTELDQPLTDTQLRLAPIEVVIAAGTDSIGSISNTDFNAIQSGSWDVSVNNLPTSFEIVDPIPVTGSVEISNDIDSPITISGNVTANTGLTQPLTDTQLRASSVDTNITNASIAVTGAFYPATQPVSLTTLPALATGSNVIGSISNTSFAVSNFPSTQAITATTLPLPTGAATASNQSTIIGHVDGIEGLLATIDADTSLLSSTIASSKIQVDVVTAPTTTVSDGGSSLTVDGVVELGASTLIALGSNNGTTEITNDVNNPIPVSASSLPLPTGAASETTLNSVNAKLPSNLTVTATRLLVDGSGVTQPISGTVTANTGLVQPLTNTELRASPVSVSLAGGTNSIGSISNTSFNVGNFPSTQAITATSLPLPTGAATSQKQDTGNTSLNSIDTKTPTLGQALAAASVPVVLTAEQITTLTPPTSVVVSNLPATQPVSLAALPALATGSNIIGSIGNTVFGATQSGNWDVSVNNFPTTVEVSNDGGNPLAISGTVTADIGLDQPLTDTQLRASPVPIVEGLSIPTYNHMSLSYSGNNLSQVIYKVGGVNGTTVATLNLSYDSNNNITSITKV